MAESFHYDSTCVKFQDKQIEFLVIGIFENYLRDTETDGSPNLFMPQMPTTGGAGLHQRWILQYTNFHLNQSN